MKRQPARGGGRNLQKTLKSHYIKQITEPYLEVYLSPQNERYTRKEVMRNIMRKLLRSTQVNHRKVTAALILLFKKIKCSSLWHAMKRQQLLEKIFLKKVIKAIYFS